MAERWEKLLSENIKQHAQLADLEDEITLFLESGEGQGFVASWLETFERCFYVYCRGAGDRGTEVNTMDMEEYFGFLKDAGLIRKEFTVREARTIFVQVNLDDDLYVQDDVNEGNSSSELVLDEFVECMVRIACELTHYEVLHHIVSDDAHAEELADRREGLREMLDGFVEDHLHNKKFGKLRKAK